MSSYIQNTNDEDINNIVLFCHNEVERIIEYLRELLKTKLVLQFGRKTKQHSHNMQLHFINENLRIYNVLKHKRLKRTTYIYPEQRYHKSANHIHCPRAIVRAVLGESN